MHELGIAESAMKATLLEMEKRGATQLHSLTLRIGSMSSVDPEALRFAFYSVSRSSGYENAILKIEEVQAVAICQSCNHRFTTDETVIFKCPKCEEYTSELHQGREIELARIEME